MSFWSAMVAIVAIIAFTATRIVRYAAGSNGAGRLHRSQTPPPSPREIALQREVEDLRERIAVLERIATEANSSSERRTRAIADEIESLRDS